MIPSVIDFTTRFVEQRIAEAVGAGESDFSSKFATWNKMAHEAYATEVSQLNQNYQEATMKYQNEHSGRTGLDAPIRPATPEKKIAAIRENGQAKLLEWERHAWDEERLGSPVRTNNERERLCYDNVLTNVTRDSFFFPVSGGSYPGVGASARNK